MGYGELLRSLVLAFEGGEWNRLRAELSTIMDVAITDGAYGRALLQFVPALPAGVDPLFDRYRGAASALSRVGTTHSREILSRLAQRHDEVGRAAVGVAQRPGVGLSERALEVLSLTADGLTNKQIGEKLFLSPHSIGRHLANARAKLGGSNRAEAAVRLHGAGARPT